MSFGKRYLPVIAPDDETLMGTEFVAGMYDSEAVANNVHLGYRGCHHARTLCVDLDDLPRVGAPLDAQHQHAERMATKWLAEYQRLCDLTATVPRDPPKWTCVVCSETHPADRAGLFCGICKIMAACCSCELTFKGQCHARADKRIQALVAAVEDYASTASQPDWARSGRDRRILDALAAYHSLAKLTEQGGGR